MSSVSEKYKIKFFNKVTNMGGATWNSKRAKSENGNFIHLSHYLLPFGGGNEEELRDGFISQVDQVLAGANPATIFLDLQVEQMTQQTAKLIYEYGGVTEMEELPSSDFRQILQEWYDFLKTPPLDNQDLN